MKLDLPAAPQAAKRQGVRSDLSARALQMWQPLALAENSNDTTYNVLQAVGADWWADEEVTAQTLAAFLQRADGRDVLININSPGGDMFEGLAMYNLLRDYSGKVTVRVVGIAASAASIIAMAADDLQMGEAAFLMIHNAWVLAAGNRTELAAVAEWLAPFDDAMAGIYAARSGLAKDEVALLMDNESYINAERAVALGFADGHSDTATVAAASADARAAHQIDVLLAKQGVPRSERRRLMKDLKGTPGAALQSTPGAGEQALVDALKSILADKAA